MCKIAQPNQIVKAQLGRYLTLMILNKFTVYFLNAKLYMPYYLGALGKKHIIKSLAMGGFLAKIWYLKEMLSIMLKLSCC